MVPPPTMASDGKVRAKVAMHSSAPGRFNGTSSTRKPLSTKASPTACACAGSNPRKMATKGSLRASDNRGWIEVDGAAVMVFSK